jgi:hypothetical protein
VVVQRGGGQQAHPGEGQSDQQAAGGDDRLGRLTAQGIVDGGVLALPRPLDDPPERDAGQHQARDDHETEWQGVEGAGPRARPAGHHRTAPAGERPARPPEVVGRPRRGGEGEDDQQERGRRAHGRRQ